MIKLENLNTEHKEYPRNFCMKWSEEEEELLLEELNKNIDIQIIAEKHNRTVGGIRSRRNIIAYNMYNQNIPIEEIILKTKLDKLYLLKLINKKQNKTTKYKSIKNIENDIIEIKLDIKQIKININELSNIIKESMNMIKAIYDFENS